MRGRTQLQFYAAHFSTVEINNSFYRLPEREIFESWRDQAGEDFVFAVKASRFLTHVKRLHAPAQPLRRFLNSVAGLGDMLGPVLFQLPGRWNVNVERLDELLKALARRRDMRWVIEFRDASWLIPEVYARMEDAGVALCLPVGKPYPLDIRLTAPWTYIRMHHGRRGIRFGDTELTAWAERIRSFRKDGADVYVYFNNDTGGHAPRDAERLLAMLS